MLLKMIKDEDVDCDDLAKLLGMDYNPRIADTS